MSKWNLSRSRPSNIFSPRKHACTSKSQWRYPPTSRLSKVRIINYLYYYLIPVLVTILSPTHPGVLTCNIPLVVILRHLKVRITVAIFCSTCPGVLTQIAPLKGVHRRWHIKPLNRTDHQFPLLVYLPWSASTCCASQRCTSSWTFFSSSYAGALAGFTPLKGARHCF